MIISHYISGKSHKEKVQVMVRALYQPWRVGEREISLSK